MSDKPDIVERLRGYDEIGHMDRNVQGDIADARREIIRLREALEWTKATHDELLEDGDLILCAVPVVNNASGHSYWDVSLLRVNCDEHFFRLVEVESGDVWGWDWLDVEYWRRVKPPPRAALKGPTQ